MPRPGLRTAWRYAQGLLSIVGLGRWQELDPAFAPDGRHTLKNWGGRTVG
jgi:hypothetical protein